MLAGQKLSKLNELVESATKEELIWINGYLAGFVAGSAVEKDPSIAGILPALPSKVAVGKISILYGTETGNSKKLSVDFAGRAKKLGINVKLTSLDQYRLTDLPKEEYLFLVVSTQGDGEPPAAAKKFYDYIHQNNLQLNKLKFGVLALGDTSYPLFCKTGEDVDARLNTLGGKRIVPLQKCDTDYESLANEWFELLTKALSNTGSDIELSALTVSAPVKKSSGKKNFSGKILSNVNLNGRGSDKETFHIEIAADELDYQPGDSIGIIPENSPDAVVELIMATNADSNKSIEHRVGKAIVYELLRKKLNIFHLPERVVKQYATITGHDIPATRIDLLHLLKIYPVKSAKQFEEEIIPILDPITPRLYSIASSPSSHSGEVHLTVAKNSFVVNNKIKFGLCSEYLSQVKVNGKLDFYIHKNLQFRLPAPDKDIIMIGPGTGIAPFRSFIAEREANGANGHNWLFFGDQHFTTDFLYQTEIQNWTETGVLTKVNVAFSRDQQEKVYVQHKMLEEGAAFFEWLQSGAYLYICGTKEPMSVDVENTILQIVQQYGSLGKQQAEEYLQKLKDEGRFLKDVY